MFKLFRFCPNMNYALDANKYHIPNLGKSCGVLEFISDFQGNCTLKEIASKLEIPRTTALRITQTLLGARFLAVNEDGGFTLGTSLVRIGVKALDNLDIRSFARPILKTLTEDTGESSHVAILNGDKAILIEVMDNPYPVRIASRPGTLVDIHCSATGKVFLAFSIPDPLPFCENLELSAHTKFTDTTVKNVLSTIQQTLKNGYALDNEEYVLGARCIAAPIKNAFGKTIAAIGITASTSTFKKSKIPRMAQRTVAAATEISINMGFGHG